MKPTIHFGVIVLAVLSFALSGCGSPSNNAEQTSTPPADASDGKGAGPEHDHGEHGDHRGHDNQGHVKHEHNEHGEHSAHGRTDMQKMKAALAKLSPEDAASAEKQHFCPVSGDMLGVMGVPKKFDVNGQHVWICCDGCKDKLLANPDKYLAKLKKE